MVLAAGWCWRPDGAGGRMVPAAGWARQAGALVDQVGAARPRRHHLVGPVAAAQIISCSYCHDRQRSPGCHARSLREHGPSSAGNRGEGSWRQH